MKINKRIREESFGFTLVTKGTSENKGFIFAKTKQIAVMLISTLFFKVPLVTKKSPILYPYSLIFKIDRNLLYRRHTNLKRCLTILFVLCVFPLLGNRREALCATLW